MATSYTSLLGLALPVTGELAGTWGDTVNNSITALLDTAVAGTTTLSTDADVTLTTTTGATNQARQAILLCSGARTAVRNITAPAQSKMYVVINNTTGGYGVVIRGVGPTTGVTVASGKTAVVVWNGSDFVEVAPATATTATNLAGGAAGSLPYQSGAGATTFLSIGTNNFVLTSNGTAPVWTTNTGTGNVVRATSPTLVTPVLGTPTSGTLTNCTGLPISTGVSGLGANVATFLATPSSANLAAAVTDETGSGALVFGTSPTLVTPTFTTSATFPLHIGGTGTTSTLTLRSTSGVGTTGADIIFQTGNNGATEAMRILNSGNVGIGTASPTTLIQAVKTQNADTSFAIVNSDTGSAASVSVQVATDSASAILASYGSGFTPTGVRTASSSALITSAATTGGLSIAARNAAGVIRFATGGDTEKMRLDANGNLGIGTSSPATRVDINVSDSSVYVDTAAATSIIRAENTSNTTGSVGQLALFSKNTGGVLGGHLLASVSTSTNYNNNLVFQARTGISTWAERMRIDSSGNVGIGTNNPLIRLHVENAAGSYNSIADNSVGLYLKSNSAAAANNFQGIQFAALSGNSNNSAFTIGISSPTTGYSPDLIFSQRTGVSTWVERMHIDGAGNVGIGTSSPSVALHVVGVVRATDAFAVRDASNNLAGTFENDSTNLRINAEVSGKDMIFRTRTLGGSILERMRITADGNVGIGTSSPSNKLDVVGSFGRGAPVTKTGNFTLAATENWVICNGTGTITVTLPAASSWTGREVMIKTIAAQTVVSASSNVVPLAGGAAGTAILAATAGRWATLVSDGTNWVIMSAA